MFSRIKSKIKEEIEKAEERRKERERVEMEKIEREKERLLALSEKELLVELLLIMKNVQQEQKDLTEKVEQIETEVTLLKYDKS